MTAQHQSAPSAPQSGGEAELILRELDALPTLPAAATRLLAITSADDADLGEVIRLIETDPAMTAKVLSLCSRASLGISQPVTTVERAVVLLGLETVRAAVLSVQVVDWMRRVGKNGSPRQDTDRPFDAPGFWRHSIAVACAAELICREHGDYGVRPGDAFVAGLVHDLGKPALALALPKAYASVVELAAQRQSNIAEHERQVLGLDHHTAGKRLAERWGLPDPLRDAIWLHGQRNELVPEDASKPLVALVSIADALCRRLHLGWSGNHVLTPEIPELCAAAGLSESRVEGVTQRLAQNLSQRCEDLGLGTDPEDRVLLDSVLAANRQLGRLHRAMEERSRAADRRGRILSAIAEFQAGAIDAQTEGGALGIMEAVVLSAATLLGPGFFAVVMQPKDPGPWLLLRFAPDASARGHEWIEPPAGPDGKRAALTDLAAARGALGGQSAGLASWLAARLGPAATVTNLRMVTLKRAGRAAIGILIHDRAAAEAELSRELSSLIATWSAAVGAAANHARTKSLSEALAESNRNLTQTQRELAEVQSMARLGELTAGAAHEMNSPLTVISARAQSLSSRLAEGNDKAAVDAIVTAAHRMSDLLTQLHMIATPPALHPEPVSLQDLLSLVVRDAKERTSSRAVRTPIAPIKVVITAPVPPVKMDKELMGRALLELVVNAIESGPRDPIELRVEPDDAGERLLIRVVDSGLGMSDHALAHAFDPFFSEKSAGRQPGLGLPTARRLVELHGGNITLDTRQGDGTTATIELRNWRWTEPAEQKLAA